MTEAPGTVSCSPVARMCNRPLAFVGPGVRVAEQYRQTFAMLESLEPDVVLPAHTETFGYEQRRLRSERIGVAGWLDRGEYREWIVAAKAEFEALASGQPQSP